MNKFCKLTRKWNEKFEKESEEDGQFLTFNSVDEMFKHIHDENEQEKKENPIKYYSSLLWNRISWWFDKRYYQVKYFLQRNVTQGYSDDEVFDFSHHSTRYILPRLKAMRNNLHAYPGELQSEEEWEAILDEIIWSMERYLEYESAIDGLPEPYSDEYKFEWRRIQNGFELMGKWWVGLWD